MPGFEPLTLPPIDELERILDEDQIKPDVILEKIKANPRAVNEPAVLSQLAEMAKSDPVEFDLILHEIHKLRCGLKVDTVTGLVHDYIKHDTTTGPKAERDESARIAAYDILMEKDPIQAHQDYVTETVCGGGSAARTITMSGYSAYLNEDRLYADIVGGPQSGKSTTTITTLETFPSENVIVASEASPKSLYYLASQQPERLKEAIIYIDDSRPEHIPVLKTFRNESNVSPSNLTVADGEFLELVVKYRPVVIASSVTPLRDLEGQATSRAFLISVPDASDEEEKKVREKIRQNIATSALSSQKNNESRGILQEMARILRDEGIKDVVIPFDVQEPAGADRRGIGQFMRLIKVSAFIYQYQRPIIEMQDGRIIVLATYADLETAARVWFDFAEGQEFKVSPKAIDVLKALPDQWPGLSSPTISKGMVKAQRTIDRYLEDLYESGIASRERITAPGMPWGYWVEPEIRQKVLAEISGSGELKDEFGQIPPKIFWRKYMAENSPDSLKDSYIKFFSSFGIDIKKMYKGRKDIKGEEDGFEDIFSLYISRKSWPNSEKSSNDIDYFGKENLVEMAEMPTDSGSEIGGNRQDYCVIRILKDVGEIVLLDGRTVNLRREDVASIPSVQAKSLIAKGYATEIRSKGDACPNPCVVSPKAEEPGLAEFKQKVRAYRDRRTCASCGQHFDNPLVVHGPGGYICESCRRGDEQIAPQADSQTRLAEMQAT